MVVFCVSTKSLLELSNPYPDPKKYAYEPPKQHNKVITFAPAEKEESDSIKCKKYIPLVNEVFGVYFKKKKSMPAIKFHPIHIIYFPYFCSKENIYQGGKIVYFNNAIYSIRITQTERCGVEHAQIAFCSWVNKNYKTSRLYYYYYNPFVEKWYWEKEPESVTLELTNPDSLYYGCK
jgi:hypothetical protein